MLHYALIIAAHVAQADSGLVFKKPNEMRIAVQRSPTRPVIDGKIDEAVWRSAIPLTRFVQFEPVDSVLPRTQSVGWVTYDARHLYVAFRAYEPDRRKIRATMHARERGGEAEDKVSISIDTYNDNRRTYVLRVSALGLQEDGIKTEGMGRTDNTPDFVWHSAARIDDEGWTMEAAIPFASLRWPRSDTLNIGFDLVRWRGATGALESWAPRRRGHPCDICQQGTLVGITGIETGATTDILPYVTGSRAGVRRYGSDSALVGGGWQATRPPRDFDALRATSTVGADIRFALTSSTTLNATLNPDFSQIEADDEQIRVNQRFTIFNQERRPFFLEGRVVFETGPRDDMGGGGGGGPNTVGGSLFYSRAIVDPSAGARLTGKAGSTTFAALYARDARPGYYYFDGHDASGFLPDLGSSADVVVARLRRDVLSDSYVGVSVLGRRLDDSDNVLANGDFSLRRGPLVLSGEGAWSHDRAPLDTARSSYLDGEKLRGLSYRTRLALNGRRLQASLTASGVSPEFRDQLGRFLRVGLQSYAARAEVTQYPNNRVLQRTQQQVDVSRTHEFGGSVVDWRVSPRFEFQLRRNTSVNFSVSEELTTIFDAPLRTTALNGDFRVNASQRIAFGGFLSVGEREIVDAGNPRVGKGMFGNLNLTLRPLPQASIEVRGQRSNHYERSGGALVDDAKILRVRGTYQFTRAFGARVIGEFSDQFNSLATSPLAERTRRYSSSLLLTYELAPASFLYFGYNDARQDFEEPVVPASRVLRTGNLFFLKLSYLYRM
ncbi:MAG: DUF5916 domain-containing protein [Gemmatimonadaceae bacterium]